MFHDDELFFEELVEAVGTGFAIYDDTGRYRYVNEAYADLFGVSTEHLEGTALWEINPEFERDRFEAYWDSFDRGETHTAETRHEVGDTSVPVSVRTTCREIDGTTYHFGTISDITDKRRRERALAQFRRAIEAAGHAIFLTDRDGTIEYVNPAFEAITGYSAEEAIGRTPRILKSGEMSDSYYEEFWETILAGERWHEPVVNRRKNGEYYYASQTVSPITEGNTVRSFVAIQDDITDRIERKQTLDALDRVLRHNLRNRLNVVLANAEQLQRQAPAETDAAVETIVESVSALTETADKGHELVEFLSSNTYRQRIDIVSVARVIVDSLQERFPAATFAVDTPDTAPVLAVEKVNRAIEELLTNAVEHSGDSPATVTVTLDRFDDTTRLRVEDDGPVIPGMERQVLDGEEGIDELYHCSGLGLWLVYWIVRRSGGNLSYSETAAGGNAIEIEFQNPERADAATGARQVAE